MSRNLFQRQIKYLQSQRYLSIKALFKSKNEEYLIKSPLSEIVMPNMRFLERLWLDSHNFKNLVALECAETKKSYTYQKLQNHISVFATSLHKKLGLRPGDVVSAMLPNCPEYAVIAFGSLQAGCVLTTINPIYREFEISHQVSITEPKVIVTIPECYDVVLKGLKEAKSNPKIIVVDHPTKPIPDGAIRFSEVAESGEADYTLLDKIERKPDDIAFILFSSGTTGMPKGVEITYKNLSSGLEIMQNEKTSYAKLANGNYQDVVPCVLPFFHIYGLMVTLTGHLSKGCKLVTMSKFSPPLYFDILKNQKASLLYVVPPIAILLGKHPDVTAEHFKHVRHITCGAAPLSGSDIQAILEKSKNNLEIGQGYGATETTCLATTTLIGSEIDDYSACGVPMASMELKIVDVQNGNTVPLGQSGEIYVRGPTIMKGYYKNEEATKDCITYDGFFKTGDLGYYNPETGLYITDRIKELIKVKGMQVAPAELEGVLRSHPAVQDAAVIGVPHEYFGEIPKAFIIPKNGSKTSPEELQNFVANKVAPFKRIEEVIIVDSIPKTSSGKILRRELKKMYA